MISKRSSIALPARAPLAFMAFTMILVSTALAFPAPPDARLLNIPLSFEPNQGQAASTVQFLARGSGYSIFLAPGSVLLNLNREKGHDALRMRLVGANVHAGPSALTRQPGVVNYFIGNDPKKWRTGIPTYDKVTYPQIYPGVDLVFYGNQRRLEYDFVVAPGADPSRIAWRIDGARARMNAVGSLALAAPNGRAIFEKPVLYQIRENKKTRIAGDFVVAANEIRFRVGSYDHSRALIIDPVLSYASYLAGTASDPIGVATGPGYLQVGASQALAIDSAGSAYVAGSTFSLDFPTNNPYQGAAPAKLAGVNPGEWPTAFVTKFSPDGSSLVYSTYLGGNGSDRAYAIAVDSSGNAYVTGQTSSPNFPITSGAYQTVCAPVPNNIGEPVAVSNCNAFDWNVFVTKLNATGAGLVYSTFLGGYGSWSYATAIAVDGAGRAYIAGDESDVCSAADHSFPSCFPTTSGAVITGDKPTGGDPQFAFVAAFDPSGAHLLYSTLFGDTNFACIPGCGGSTWATSVAVDANGYFYLAGETQAAKLPTTAGVVQPSASPLGSNGAYLPASRGFVAKFSPVTSAGGTSLAYSTYLGGHTGNTGDYISGVAVDNAGNAYLAGYTNSADFPVTSGVYGTVCGLGGTCSAAHVTKLNPAGSAILWSTYVGCSRIDCSDALTFTGPIQLDGSGNIYIMGQAGPGFPLVNPLEQAGNGGAMQLLVAELDPAGASLLFSSFIGSGGLNTSYPGGLAVDSAGDIYLAGNNAGPNLITTPGAFQTTSADSTCCYHGFVAKIAASVPVVASSTAGQVEPFAPESIVSAYGTNLASGSALDDVTVTVTDSAGTARPAYLYYVSPTQINFEIPAGTATGAATVAFHNRNGTTQSAAVSIAAVSPGLFALNGSGLVATWVLPVISGVQQALQPVYQVTGGSVVPLPIDVTPATKDVYLEMYGTGIRNAKIVTVTVEGLGVSVLYAGAAPGFAGEDQVNIGPLPRSLAGTGNANIILTADGLAANMVNITIQ